MHSSETLKDSIPGSEINANIRQTVPFLKLIRTNTGARFDLYAIINAYTT
jgi:hypothetical protein